MLSINKKSLNNNLKNKIMVYKNEIKKEFICRKLDTFLNTEDLIDEKSPNCDNDEYIYLNDEEE